LVVPIVLAKELWFSREMTNWIVHCISMVRFSVLVNGYPFGIFSSFGGLRQGDHLFHLLFVIVMEVLRKIISTTVNGGFLSGISVGSRNLDMLHISHLLFADDTLIICGANLDHILYLRALFLCCEVVSSLKISGKVRIGSCG
jgi:hypothetical protein